jgi:hypothetical protein
METIDTTKTIAETLSECGFKVATNKKNPLGLPRFHATGVGNSVSDLFFWNPAFEAELFDPRFIPADLHKIRAGFIETKPGQHRGEILDGIVQNSRYYRYFKDGDARFFLEDREIHNVDVFLVGSNWSPFGMLCKAEERHQPETVTFLTDRHEARFMPCTILYHGMQRRLQEEEDRRILVEKRIVPANHRLIETGVLASKIPRDPTLKLTFEFWAWIGNTYLPLITADSTRSDSVETMVLLQEVRERAVYVETQSSEKVWLPRSQIQYDGTLDDAERKWIKIRVQRWLYNKQCKLFGAS